MRSIASWPTFPTDTAGWNKKDMLYESSKLAALLSLDSKNTESLGTQQDTDSFTK